MAFMISRETENVQSSSDVEAAFKALTQDGERQFITSQELYAVSKMLRKNIKKILYRNTLLVSYKCCSTNMSFEDV